jgi:membrane protease YdiL (CAAX protease family)
MNEAAQPPDATELTLTPPPKHDVHWVFFGPNGLRAGWGVLMFVAIFLGTEFLLSWLLRPTLHKMAPAKNAPLGLSFALLLELMQAVVVAIATVALALIEHRPVFGYGYLGRAKLLRFISGLLYGFAAISAVVGMLWKAGLLVIDGQMLHGGDILRNAAGWACMFLVVAIFEESLLRGYLQYTLTRGLGFWWSALLFSFLFGFSHGTNPGETPVGLFSAGAVGLVFCLSLWYTGSLWWAVGFHAAWDWGQSYFYGTSDSGMMVKGHLLAEHPLGQTLWSGGATGPEGSLVVLPFLLLVAFLMWLWWGKRGETPWRGYAWKPAPAPASKSAESAFSLQDAA